MAEWIYDKLEPVDSKTLSDKVFCIAPNVSILELIPSPDGGGLAFTYDEAAEERLP